MLFIKEYNAKSLDRSSVSMIDKYNVRLDIVGKLLDNLSSLIDNLMSLIRDIRTSLGQSKQRIYNNLDQVKEVIEGNDITGTESTIEAIESALEAGDEAIDEAEATLEGIEAAIECSQDYCNDTNVDVACGETLIPETCNEQDIPAPGDCDVCSFSVANGVGTDDCTVCSHGACSVDLDCSEDKPWDSDAKPGCSHSVTYTDNGKVETDESCDEITRDGVTDNPPSDCVYTCSDSSSCQQFPMPEDCTYTCIDGGGGCSYEGDDCSYSSSCGQPELCNETECDQYDCGEPCGETCHMTNDEGDCSEGSCGEDDGNDDGPCNQYDCSEYDCGEPCGESCGLL